jgi:hypothetical protein
MGGMVSDARLTASWKALKISFKTTLGLLALTATLAHGHDTSAWNLKEDNALWRAECGGCHMAYPPQMLAATDWLLIMSQLEKHFGADASLDQARLDEVTNFLDRNGTGRSTHEGPGLPRITGSDRFIDKHQSAIRLWRKGKVKLLSDCLACHAGAAPGS